MARTLIAIALLIAGLAVIWARQEGPLRDPHAAFDDFELGSERAEDQLTDPLVLAGPRVRPLVLVAIANPTMPKRRYAISYLGCSHYRPALPQLLLILGNEDEQDYFRADALEAAWLTDPPEGRHLAAVHADRTDFLGKVAAEIQHGTWKPYCRSWLDAFRGTHD